jgi:hypothetical protein
MARKWIVIKMAKRRVLKQDGREARGKKDRKEAGGK